MITFAATRRSTLRRRRRRAGHRRHAARRGWLPASAGRPSMPTTARPLPSASPSCGARCRPRVKLHYAMKANPMPALVGHLARARRRASTWRPRGEMQDRAERRRRARAHQLRRTGQERRRRLRRRSLPASSSISNRAPVRKRVAEPASDSASRPRACGAGQPCVRAQVLGHEDGRGRQAVRHRPGACPDADRADARRRHRSRSASTSTAARRT